MSVSTEEQHGPGTTDVGNLIQSDLENIHRARRNHFVPALLVAILGIGTFFAITGLREDLLAQSLTLVTMQSLVWVVALGVFPAIGVGLIFPSKVTKSLAVFIALVATGLSTLELGHGLPASLSFGFDACLSLLLVMGSLIGAMALFSGAFLQRRSASSVYLVSAGVSLAALNTVTWNCHMSGPEHVIPSHLGGAMLLMMCMTGLAIIAHSRRKRDPVRAEESQP